MSNSEYRGIHSKPVLTGFHEVHIFNTAGFHLTWCSMMLRSRVQIQQEVISDLKRENQFLSKGLCESFCVISRERYVNPGQKLNFKAHGIMKSISELWARGQYFV